MMILDAMEKSASVSVLQAELNDRPGVCLKLIGPLGDIEAATQAAEQMARAIQIEIITHIIAAPSEHSRPAYEARPEISPLIEQAVVQIPQGKEGTMNEQASYAVGLIETQGFTAVFEAIDTAYDAVVANIYADVIQANARVLHDALVPNGWFAFSGCTSQHATAVRDAIEGSGLAIEECRVRGRWHTFLGTRGS